MIENVSIRYVNHEGASVDLNAAPFDWVSTDLFDYGWQYNSLHSGSGRGSKISGIRREIVERKIELDVFNSDVSAAMNELQSVFEPDVLASVPGRLYFGSQYLLCYISASNKPEIISRYLVSIVLTLAIEYPFWISESLHTFMPSSTGSSTGFIFPLAFPFGFTSPDVRTLVNDHYGPCLAKITFYGPCTDPEINLGPNTYKVFGELLPGERFEIDQVAMTVTKITAGGERLNFLYARGKTKSVFDRIPAGESFVTATDFTFEILLYKERSEPKWS